MLVKEVNYRSRFAFQRDARRSDEFWKRLVFSTLSAVVCVVFFGACEQVYRTGIVPVPNQIISGPVEIKSEWTEITPPAPLKPLGSQHWVTLRYRDFDIKNSPLNSDRLQHKDGTTTQIEAVLFDESGNGYELVIKGYGLGVDLYFKENPNEPGLKDFPTDRTYTKLRIRSEHPLPCDGIEWVSSATS